VHRDHQLDDKSSSLHMHGGIKGKLAAAKMVTESTSGRRTWWPTPTALLSKVMEIMRGAFGTVSMGGGEQGAVRSREEFEQEVRALGKVRHPNLLLLKGYYWTP
jgi:hypothetical protein